MRTIFESSPFGSMGVGQVPLAPPLHPSSWHRLGAPSPGLGQDIGDITDKLLDAFKGLDKDALGKFKPQYDECKKKLDEGAIGLIAAFNCFDDLYKDVRKYIKGEEERKAAEIRTTPTTPPKAEFPWLPVGLAVAGAGILIYFITRG